jgi:hypothetical protein
VSRVRTAYALIFLTLSVLRLLIWLGAFLVGVALLAWAALARTVSRR